MTAPLRIRPAAPADLDAVWQLCQTTKARLHADGIAIGWDDNYPPPDIFAADAAEGGLLAAFAGDELAGALSVTADHAGEYFWALPADQADARARALLAHADTTPEQAVGLHRLMVAPAARRTGVAQALLAAAPRYFPGKRITFLAAAGNGPALALYRKLGYADCGEFAFDFGRARLFADRR